MGLEGIVSKRLGSRYNSGRTRGWLKFKNPEAPASEGSRECPLSWDLNVVERVSIADRAAPRVDVTMPITLSAPPMAATPRKATKLSRARHANGSASESNRSRFMTVSLGAPPVQILL
jgi:hypothetical protein